MDQPLEQSLDPEVPQAAAGENPEEEGYIRCLCGLEEDDGFTICCDACLAWQHALCVNVDLETVPDTYLCEQCDPDPDRRSLAFNVDPEWALDRQTLRRTAEVELRARRDDLTDTEALGYAREIAYGRVSLSALKEEPKRRKRKSVPQVETRASRSQGGPMFGGAATPSYTQDGHPVGSMLVMEDEEDYQAWLYEYTATDELHWADEAAAEQVRAALQAWFSRQQAASSNDETETLDEAPAARYAVHFKRDRFGGQVKWTRRRLRAHARRSSAPAPEFARYDANEDMGIAAPVGLVEIPDLPPAMPRTAIAEVPVGAISLAPSINTPFASGAPVPAPFPRAPALGFFALEAIPAGAFISTITGQVVSAPAYRADPVNQYKTLGLPKPHVKGVPGPWSVYLDARQCGSDARFVRAGCHPNAVVRPVVYRARPAGARAKAGSATEAFELTFALFALTDIVKREEVVLPWDWDDAHVAHTLPALLGLPTTAYSLEPSPPLSRQMAAVALALLSLAICACEKRKDCALAWLWKLACASQPASAGAGNRREVEGPDAIRDRMLQQLASLGPVKKGGRPKKPDLGSLLELRRGWLDRGGEEEEAPPPWRAAAVPLDPAHRGPESLSAVKVETDAEAMDVDEADARPFRIFEGAADSPAVLTSNDAVLGPETNRLQSPIHMDGLPMDGPTLADDVQYQEQLALDLFPPAPPFEEDVVMRQPEPIKEPTPEPAPEPVKEPTPPPPPPPRAKLSFAAYRKRQLEKQPEPEAPPAVLTEEPASMDTVPVKNDTPVRTLLSPRQPTARAPAFHFPTTPAFGLPGKLAASLHDTPPYSPRDSPSSAEAFEPKSSPTDVPSAQRSPGNYVRPAPDAFIRSPQRPPDKPRPQGFFPPARQQFSTLSSYATASSAAYFPPASTSTAAQYPPPSKPYPSSMTPNPYQRERSESPVRSPSPRPRSVSPVDRREPSPEPYRRAALPPQSIPTGPRGTYNRFPGRGGANVRGRGLNLMPFQAQSRDSGYANMARRSTASQPGDDAPAFYSSRDVEPPKGPKLAYNRPAYPPRDGPPPSGPRRGGEPPRGPPVGPAADRYRRDYSPEYADGPPIPRGPARAMTRGFYVPRGGYRGRGRGG